MTRPVNLSLVTFRYPMAAIVSILHRISGIVILAGVGYFAYLLELMLESPASFDWVFDAVHTSYHGLIVWAVLTAVAYHVIAGIRHLLLDFHIGDTLSASRATAWTVLILTAAVSIALAWWFVT